MMRTLLAARVVVALTVAAAVGTWGLHTHPIEMRDVFVALIAIRRPILFDVLAYTYATLWFTTPFLATSLVTSILVIAVSRRPASRRPHALPPYPAPDTRPTPMLVLGETHYMRMPGRAATLTRLAHCVLTANVGLPHRSIQEAIGLAIHLVVQIARVGPSRRVTEVIELHGYDTRDDRYLLDAERLLDDTARPRVEPLVTGSV